MGCFNTRKVISPLKTGHKAELKRDHQKKAKIGEFHELI